MTQIHPSPYGSSLSRCGASVSSLFTSATVRGHGALGAQGVKSTAWNGEAAVQRRRLANGTDQVRRRQGAAVDDHAAGLLTEPRRCAEALVVHGDGFGSRVAKLFDHVDQPAL